MLFLLQIAQTIIVKLFIDGQFVGDGIHTTDGVYNSSLVNNILMLGSTGSLANNQFFKGTIDDFGVWNRVMSQQEITNLYTSSLPTSACLPEYVPTNGLVGYWPFCGNANDESDNGNNGTVNGATLVADRFGNSNSSYSFNGITDNISVLNNTSLNFESNNKFSLAYWINPATLSATQVNFILCKQNSMGANQDGWNSNVEVDYTSNYKIKNGTSTSTCSFGTDTTLLSIEIYSHIVQVCDNGTSYMYINGILISQSACTALIGDNTSNMLIGMPTFTYGNAKGFNGIIDDIGIWNRALTPEEIQQLYTGSTVNPDDFTLYMDTIPGINGQEVLVPVRVKNFNNMLSAQFTLQFDPAVISYAGFQNAGISTITGSSFGQTQISNGILTFAWSQPSVTAVSLDDDELLFNLKFNVIGSGGSFSPINFINSPTPIEFVDQSFIPLTSYQILPGRVDVLNLAAISGSIKTKNGNGIRSTTLSATGFATENKQTNLAGEYNLLLPQGQNYTITPTKGNDTLVTNGITTLDVLLIQRHILGILPLNSPYKIIAADVNQSGTVTSADLNLINALILANIGAYPSGQFWAFVPDDHVFTNPANPFPYPSERSYSELNTSVNQDFIGMKLGDVNQSYNPALARYAKSDSDVELYVEDQNVTEEATIEVPVRVKNFNNISGFQFAIQWNADMLSYVEINPENGGLNVNKGETNVTDGKLNINWIEPDAGTVSIDDEGALFYITFEVLGAMGSSTSVEVYSSPTTPVEIIDENLEVINHNLQAGLISVTTPSSIMEVNVSGIEITAYPNPFKEFTTLSIQSDVQRKALIDVYDLSGKLLSSEFVNLKQGNTQLQINTQLAQGSYLIVLKDATTNSNLGTIKILKQ